MVSIELVVCEFTLEGSEHFLGFILSYFHGKESFFERSCVLSESFESLDLFREEKDLLISLFDTCFEFFYFLHDFFLHDWIRFYDFFYDRKRGLS